MASFIQIRIDDELKKQATTVFEELGLDLSTAVRMFLKKSVAVNGLPFNTRNNDSSLRLIDTVKLMQEISNKNGNCDLTLEEINEIIDKTRKERK